LICGEWGTRPPVLPDQYPDIFSTAFKADNITHPPKGRLRYKEARRGSLRKGTNLGSVAVTKSVAVVVFVFRASGKRKRKEWLPVKKKGILILQGESNALWKSKASRKFSGFQTTAVNQEGI